VQLGTSLARAVRHDAPAWMVTRSFPESIAAMPLP
jgi:hypothetical protein